MHRASMSRLFHMTRSARSLRLGLAALLPSATVFAQSISTTPALAVPVSGPLMVLLLGAGLLASSVWFLRHRAPPAVVLLVAFSGGATLWHGAVVLAQSLSTFDNPAGQTLPIPVTQIQSGPDVAGFEWADFSNGSGTTLVVSSLVEPTFAQCFPNGVTGTLLPPAVPPASPPPACNEGLTLVEGAMCRANVDTMCRAAAAGQLATLTTISPTLGPATGGTPVTLTGTNLTGATAVTFGGIAATSVTVVNATTLTVVTPAHSAGMVDVVVATPRGGATLADAYQYQPRSTLAAIGPSSGAAMGLTGVTLTGTNLAGTTSVTFGGVAATSVSVINSTTVTAVTPAHAIGAVDVVIQTPSGDATLSNGFTFLATAVGQSTAGGTIGALDGGLRNLVAATADNSTAVEWGGLGITSNAQSSSDGSANTATIISVLGTNGGTPYAAEVCSAYEVDSQGNTPCQAGNACYNDWFLPAQDQLDALYINQAAIGGFSVGVYWSSTEFSANPTFAAWFQSFQAGFQAVSTKVTSASVRCVRSITP